MVLGESQKTFMSVIKTLLVIAGILILGAIGALIFNVSLLPYFLASTYFDDFQFVKDFKQGKIVVNPKEEIRIQENVALQDAISRVKKSVVTFQGVSGVRHGLIVTSDGTILTLANGMVANGSITVSIEGVQMNARVLKVDSKNNLSLLKIEKQNLPTVGFINPAQLNLGQRVFLAVATSVKQDNWLANEGIIREIGLNSIKTNIIESRIASGSPLFTITGELVGLNFVDAEGKISAVPISKIKEFLGL